MVGSFSKWYFIYGKPTTLKINKPHWSYTRQKNRIYFFNDKQQTREVGYRTN
jgi:hypothetical protein